MPDRSDCVILDIASRHTGSGSQWMCAMGLGGMMSGTVAYLV